MVVCSLTMKHTRVVSTKCNPGFACRAFSDTTLVCFIVNEHTTKCSHYTHRRTDGRTHRQTDAGNDNTRRPKLASGNKMTQIVCHVIHIQLNSANTSILQFLFWLNQAKTFKYDPRLLQLIALRTFNSLWPSDTIWGIDLGQHWLR